ncbi:MAG: glycosyltransferase family 4 protein [Moorea sp. SIO2B7]|nr:glycosyltransferase family 4 protein [Moorena sp. SIO2B7]
MTNNILWLRRSFNWMGQHSGYDQVCAAISKLQPGNYKSFWQEPGKRRHRVSRNFLKSLAAKAESSPVYTPDSTAAEVGVLWQSLWQKPDIVHITYVENLLGILPKFSKRRPLKMVGTTHLTAGWWRLFHRHPESTSALDALIVLASREVAYFEQYLPGRVYFIPHGVDTGFFRPKEKPIDSVENSQFFRCVFSGKYLRDFQTLAEVIDRVIARNPGIKFDLVVPRKSRILNDALLMRIARHEQVFWHAELSDEQLLEIYQQASMLILPIIDCTANNGLLEAISCGLPVVSNDVGGLRDYTQNTFADLLPVGDVEGMTNAILKLADDPQARIMRGKAARLFAEQNLSWNQIAHKTLEVYDKIR